MDAPSTPPIPWVVKKYCCKECWRIKGGGIKFLWNYISYNYVIRYMSLIPKWYHKISLFPCKRLMPIGPIFKANCHVNLATMPWSLKDCLKSPHNMKWWRVHSFSHFEECSLGVAVEQCGVHSVPHFEQCSLGVAAKQYIVQLVPSFEQCSLMLLLNNA
jgi:hypothetical protein